MPQGHQAAFDRLTTLVASTASLAEDGSGVTAFTRYPSRLDLDDGTDAGIHRAFHLLYDGAERFGGQGGSFSGSVLDDFTLVTVQVGYFEGGGDLAALGGERHGVDRLAMDDLDRLRQHLQHPSNFDHATTGIVNIEWLGTRRLSSTPGVARRIYELRLRVWMRHSVLS